MGLLLLEKGCLGYKKKQDHISIKPSLLTFEYSIV